MADGSRYLKCDQCGAVLDRRADGDHKTGGAFRYGAEHELRALSTSLGWTRPTLETDLCPSCSRQSKEEK
jgi:hypothetical protein